MERRGTQDGRRTRDIDGLTRIPVELDLASEFRYRDLVPTTGAWSSASRSRARQQDAGGGAVREADGREGRCRDERRRLVDHADADAVLFTHAGLEIGVAATKTFSLSSLR